MFQPKAEVICDSVNESGDRLTTFVLTFHRFILPEFATHRVFSKNSSSSRAIPVEKMITKMIADDAYPLHWGRKQKGMVADLEIDEADQLEAISIWEEARQDAIKHAKRLLDIGIHKQVVNRLIEPFSTITVICTGTEYQNFFEQRCHPDAQPEIRALADAMKREYDASEPNLLLSGQWHRPFWKVDDWDEMLEEFGSQSTNITPIVIKVCVGRCARVSYLNHDGVRSLADDIKLHDRLLTAKPAHLSPFEHCAISSNGKFANFTGFQSYRNIIETEISQGLRHA